MADQTLTERLQPSLLDRLMDAEPGSMKEGREDRVIDLRRLREIVQRDLSWLLNVSDNGRMIPEEEYPHAARSVLNYGIREVAGAFSNAANAFDIRTSILRAVQRFEPRINPDTIEVRMRETDMDGRAVVSFDIIADMWAQPMPVELYLRTDLDLTTGQIRLERGM